MSFPVNIKILYQAFIHSINLKKAGVGQPKYCNNAYVHVVLTMQPLQIFSITWMPNVKEVHGKPRLHVYVNLLFGRSMAAMSRDSFVAVARTRPRATPLAMKTMRKSTHGFPFLSCMSMGLRLVALRVPGAPLLFNSSG